MKLKKNNIVYLTAFLKSNKNRFYVCKGLIKELPNSNNNGYKIQIFSVADRAVGTKDFVAHQASLLGRVITKKEEELHTELTDFMRPRGWIELVPSD